MQGILDKRMKEGKMEGFVIFYWTGDEPDEKIFPFTDVDGSMVVFETYSAANACCISLEDEKDWICRIVDLKGWK